MRRSGRADGLRTFLRPFRRTGVAALIWLLPDIPTPIAGEFGRANTGFDDPFAAHESGALAFRAGPTKHAFSVPQLSWSPCTPRPAPFAIFEQPVFDPGDR
jgi:hypothetical protein